MWRWRAPTVSVEGVNGFLAAMAGMNDGVNHVSTYALERLPDAASVDEAVRLYCRRDEAWKWLQGADSEEPRISSKIVPGDWRASLRPLVERWFFGQEFSPKVVNTVIGAEKDGDRVLDSFFELLSGVVGHGSVYLVEAPTGGDLVQDDIVFEEPGGRWLLHFGFVD